jgi:hypothetical protein
MPSSHRKRDVNNGDAQQQTIIWEPMPSTRTLHLGHPIEESIKRILRMWKMNPMAFHPYHLPLRLSPNTRFWTAQEWRKFWTIKWIRDDFWEAPVYLRRGWQLSKDRIWKMTETTKRLWRSLSPSIWSQHLCCDSLSKFRKSCTFVDQKFSNSFRSQNMKAMWSRITMEITTAIPCAEPTSSNNSEDSNRLQSPEPVEGQSRPSWSRCLQGVDGDWRGAPYEKREAAWAGASEATYQSLVISIIKKFNSHHSGRPMSPH